MSDQSPPDGTRLAKAIATLAGAPATAGGHSPTQEAIAILLTVGAFALLVLRIPVPQELWAAVGLAVGYYFRSAQA